ncbi:hypothetical protein FRZ61_37130 [Hypericibacter adhaerens]|jgi:hypothetical protein|uniref:Uncharacterized protein n=1 Tax=Hypericibacter adhaerens TaxID=2602016 RepID=A0A5J6N377_9PROT|nr:hypothetical protein [Hypericibacter adhaerens]QEX23774.1 hypothetical protein FRZ61_37130 [Hypericibacter adhaerens]
MAQKSGGKRKSRKAAPRLPPIVLIQWEDSAQAAAEWQWLDQVRGPSIADCYTVGFLIARDRRELKVAINLGLRGAEAEQAAGIVAIPAACVRRVVRLRLSSSPPSFSRPASSGRAAG